MLRRFSILLEQAMASQSQSIDFSKIPRAGVVASAKDLPPPSVPDSIRLSKRLSSSGVCSRRQAERLIKAGLVSVDGKRVDFNAPVSSASAISVSRNPEAKSTTVPIPAATRLWLFYKPTGLITSHQDPLGRPSVFDYLRTKGFEGKHIISVGRLDLNSEGLLLLTNNGDLSQALEQPYSQLLREYRVRVYGDWKKEDIDSIRKGIVIQGMQYRPMQVLLERKQTSNTWFKAQLSEGKNREIRRVFEHFHLRVNRLIRVRYGPFTLEDMKTGELRETAIPTSVHQILLQHFKRQAAAASVAKACNRLIEMGSAAKRLCNPAPAPELNVLLVGPKGAGKTTFLYAKRLKPGWSTNAIRPTLGYNYETFSTDLAEMHVWDLSGEEFLRPLARTFYSNIEFAAIVFIVRQSTDVKYLLEAKRQMLGLMNELPLRNCALAVVFNRFGDQQIQKSEFLEEAFSLGDLTHIPKEKKSVFVVNASIGEQSTEVFEWLGKLTLTHD